MMSPGNFTDEFKPDAAAQITGRSHRINAVSKRLGVSLLSLFARKRKFLSAATDETDKDVQSHRLKRALARMSEERDRLKQATASVARDAS